MNVETIRHSQLKKSTNARKSLPRNEKQQVLLVANNYAMEVWTNPSKINALVLPYVRGVSERIRNTAAAYGLCTAFHPQHDRKIPM